MTSRAFSIAVFLAGLGIFVYLICLVGITEITGNIQRAGWSLLAVILVWFVVYLLNAFAWKAVLGGAGEDIGFSRLFMVTVSGFIINYITPVIALGGEPYKVKALSDTLGTRRSVSAVVLYRMVHLLGHMSLLLTGIVTALLFLSLPPILNGMLFVFALLIGGVILLTLAGHRNGVFVMLEKLIGRLPALRRIGSALERYAGDLEEMDAVLTDVYRHNRGAFYASIAFEYGSRLLMGLEVYLILYGIGVETTLVSALFLYVVYSIVINLFFFVPLNLGAREGGLYFGMGSLALTPALGIYLGVVMRIREFFWILLGLFFILALSARKTPRSAPGM